MVTKSPVYWSKLIALCFCVITQASKRSGSGDVLSNKIYGEATIEVALVPRTSDNHKLLSNQDPGGHWEVCEIPYVLEGFSEGKAVRVSEAISRLERFSAWKFLEVTPDQGGNVTQPDWVNFVSNSSGCDGQVGRKGGRQDIIVGDNCMSGNVMHLLSLTLGLHQEQTRIDRDEYITVFPENIQESGLPWYEIKEDSIPIGDYDYGSILHLPDWAYSVDGKNSLEAKHPLPPGIVLGQRNSLSLGDINGLKVRHQDALQGNMNCCASTEFMCTESHKCISQDLVGDGKCDCLDGSDESEPCECGTCEIEQESGIFGCSDAAIEQCVCQFIDACCTREYGISCAGTAANLCGCTDPQFIGEVTQPDVCSVVATGRKGFNGAINGLYFPIYELEGRVVYINTPWTLMAYYKTDLGLWLIQEEALFGSTIAFAFTNDNATTANQITNPWNVWNSSSWELDPAVTFDCVPLSIYPKAQPEVVLSDIQLDGVDDCSSLEYEVTKSISCTLQVNHVYSWDAFIDIQVDCIIDLHIEVTLDESEDDAKRWSPLQGSKISQESGKVGKLMELGGGTLGSETNIGIGIGNSPAPSPQPPPSPGSSPSDDRSLKFNIECQFGHEVNVSIDSVTHGVKGDIRLHNEGVECDIIDEINSNGDTVLVSECQIIAIATNLCPDASNSAIQQHQPQKAASGEIALQLLNAEDGNVGMAASPPSPPSSHHLHHRLPHNQVARHHLHPQTLYSVLLLNHLAIPFPSCPYHFLTSLKQVLA